MNICISRILQMVQLNDLNFFGICHFGRSIGHIFKIIHLRYFLLPISLYFSRWHISLRCVTAIVKWKWHLDGHHGWCNKRSAWKYDKLFGNIQQNIALKRICVARFCFICHRFYAYFAFFCCCFLFQFPLLGVDIITRMSTSLGKKPPATFHKYRRIFSMFMLLIHISLLRSTIRYSMLNISEKQQKSRNPK